MEDDDDLLCCPFCGTDAVKKPGNSRVYCPQCGIRHSRRMWNTRTPAMKFLILHDDKDKTAIPKAILIGGNHLAAALIAHKINPEAWISYDEIRMGCGQPWADIWVAWKAIMDSRNETQRDN